MTRIGLVGGALAALFVVLMLALASEGRAEDAPEDEQAITAKVVAGNRPNTLIVSWTEQGDVELHTIHWVGIRSEGSSRTTWTVTSGVNTFNYDDLEAGRRYYFRVAGQSEVGGSFEIVYSAEVSAVAPTVRDVPVGDPWFRYGLIDLGFLPPLRAISVDGSAEIAVSCPPPSESGHQVRRIGTHWLVHDNLPALATVTGYERFGMGAWGDVTFLVALNGGHTMLRQADPMEFMRNFLEAGSYTVAIANGQDAVFFAASLEDVIRGNETLMACWGDALPLEDDPAEQ